MELHKLQRNQFVKLQHCAIACSGIKLLLEEVGPLSAARLGDAHMGQSKSDFPKATLLIGPYPANQKRVSFPLSATGAHAVFMTS